jgi:putative membrane protein
MILNMTAPGESRGHYVGVRLLVLSLIMLPQILIGSLIAMSRQDLYPIYALCGRLLPIDPMTDQQLGGLITWIPAAMMSVVGALVLVWRWLIASERASAEPGLIAVGPRGRS